MLLAVVPARGGSKGVKDKNLRNIGGRSLVRIATEYALSEREISRTVLSTDSSDIAQELGNQNVVDTFLSLEYGGLLELTEKLYIHKRRPEHAGDNAPTIAAILDLLTSSNLCDFDSLLLLQPTSPFRVPGEVKEVIDTMVRTNTDSCVSAKRFDSPHPKKAFQLNEEGILEAEKFHSLAVPRQELESLFVFDGAFYLTRIESIQRRKSLLASRTSIYLRDGINTLNIDNEEDMMIALALVDKLEETQV